MRTTGAGKEGAENEICGKGGGFLFPRGVGWTAAQSPSSIKVLSSSCAGNR